MIKFDWSRQSLVSITTHAKSFSMQRGRRCQTDKKIAYITCVFNCTHTKFHKLAYRGIVIKANRYSDVKLPHTTHYSVKM